MSVLPGLLTGWLGSVVLPVPGWPPAVVGRIWALGSVTMSCADTSLTLPLSASIGPNGRSCGLFSTTSVLPLLMRRMSLPAFGKALEHVGTLAVQATPVPSLPVSVVVRRTLPSRASASSTSIGAGATGNGGAGGSGVKTPFVARAAGAPHAGAARPPPAALLAVAARLARGGGGAPAAAPPAPTQL